MEIVGFGHEPKRDRCQTKPAGQLIDWIAGESMHAKRVLSVTNAVVGVVNAVSLSIHAIGAGTSDPPTTITECGQVATSTPSLTLRRQE